MLQQFFYYLPYLLLGTVSTGFTFLAYKKLDWAVLLIVIALPSYLLRFKLFGVPMTCLELMILLAFFAFLIKRGQFIWVQVKENLQKHFIKYRYPFDWELVVWLVLALIAVMVAGFSTGAFGVWKAYFFEAVIFYLLFVNCFSKDKSWVRVIWALAISALLVCLVGWYQKFIDIEFLNPVWSHQIEPRITSVFPYSNAVGLYLGPIIVLMTAYARKLAQLKNKYNYILACLLVVISLLSMMTIAYARSEGALIGVLVGLSVLIVFSSKRMALLAVAMIVLTSLLLIIRPEIKELIIEKATLSDLAGEIRKQQWRETRTMLTSSPQKFIFGSGLNNYPQVIQPFHSEGIFYNFDKLPPEEHHRYSVFNEVYRASHWKPVQIYQYPHNILLNFWTELGIVGLILVLWLVIKFFVITLRLYLKYKDPLVLGLLASLVVWLIHGIVDVPYFKNDLAVMWWLWFAMLAVVIINDKYERSFTKSDCK